MTEQEFLDKIRESTGRTVENGEFGFITGRFTPFVEFKISSNKEDYFVVWKKFDGVEKELNVYQDTQENYLKTIIDFLNEKN